MSIQNFNSSGLLSPSPATLAPPPYPVQYVRVSGGIPAGSGRTTLHAVLDYDDDEDDGRPPPGKGYNPSNTGNLQSEEFRGPVLVKNGSVPVVPLYTYSSTYNNGTLVHIPVLWTALSLALGLEIKGDIIRGTPCIKRHHQLFCPTAGNSYPIERIELFIDENKALMKRMYGEFQVSTEYGPPGQEIYETDRRRRSGSLAGGGGGGGGGSTSSYFNKARPARQTAGGIRTPNTNSSDTGRVDACQAKVEIVTPYWAANSAAKIRAIVNTQHFEQAIHQEVCSKVQTNRCGGDCGCEQKYKWHRLLAYDPDNDCKGIFMDWFLFPSCCVCRCNSGGNAGQQVTQTRNRPT